MPIVSTTTERSLALAKTVSVAMASSVPILTSAAWRTTAPSSPAAQTTTVVTSVLASQASLVTASIAKMSMSVPQESINVMLMPTVRILKEETSVPVELDTPVTVSFASILTSAQLARTTATKTLLAKTHQVAFRALVMLVSQAMESTVPISMSVIWPTRAVIMPSAQTLLAASLVLALRVTPVTDKTASM